MNRYIAVGVVCLIVGLLVAAPKRPEKPAPAEPDRVVGTYEVHDNSPVLEVDDGKGNVQIYWLVFRTAVAEQEAVRGLVRGTNVVAVGKVGTGGIFRYVEVLTLEGQ